MPVNDSLIRHLEQTTGRPLPCAQIKAIGGGDINAAYRLRSRDIDWFIKLNSAQLSHMFAAEAQGLQELAAAGQVRVPNVVAWGEHDSQAYLVLDFIELRSMAAGSAGEFGRQLANLHRLAQPYFGWHSDNTIGSTPQHNARHGDWVEFWQSRRLAKQLQFAAENGFHGSLQSRGHKLLEQLPAFFSSYRPQPSLLHGDLWGGNAAADNQGNPVMFDPACYYGDRETDIAMTELFGGFGADFYRAYQAEFPLDAGYKTRKTLYNLYHILNHLNLFGGGYLGQAGGMIDRLLAEV
jgi:protein-ribulosamine 3-kinase